MVQSFTYDAHDKLTSGMTGGTGETTTYDLNGSLKTDSLTGQSYTYDDEDRLISATGPGFSDTFTYNGLGLRVAKTDSTGSYSYLCDGASPASPVLSDGHATYTPGLSENRGGSISYPAFDRIGNLWTQDASGSSQLYYEDLTGFGGPTYAGGSAASPFKYGGENGCQTDADTGLVLMGHRYMDPRTGRFITQDPAEDGGNWYAYAGNDPVKNTDPTGLQLEGSGPSPFEQMATGGAGTLERNQSFLEEYSLNEALSEQRKAIKEAQITLASDKGQSFFGFIQNNSSESIVIEFDKFIKTAAHPNGLETLWRVTLDPGFESTPLVVDVDFVLLPKSQGGVWAHLLPNIIYQAIDLLNGQQAIVPGIFRPMEVGSGLFPKTSGYPYLPAFISGTAGAYGKGYVKRNSPSFGFPFAPFM